MARSWFSSLTLLLAGAALAPAQAPSPGVWGPRVAQAAPDAPVAPAEPVLVPGQQWGHPPEPAPRFWAGAEYLLWSIKDATGAPAVFGTIPTRALTGAVDISSAITPLSGDLSRLDYGTISGVKLSAGAYLDGGTTGFDASYFQLERKTLDASFSSPGEPIIGPVYFDPVRGRQVILLYAVPGPTNAVNFDPRSATLTSTATSRLWGADANVRQQVGALLFADRLDLLVGFRHIQFGEGVAIDSTSVPAAGASPLATTVVTRDRFSALNQFYGGQVGLASHSDIGRFTLDVVGKIAVGGIVETLKVDGSTTLTTPGGPARTFAGGVLAQPTNIGSQQRGRVAWAPELTVTGGARLAPWLKATVGYDFLYLANVVRATNQFDAVDGRQVRAAASFDPTAAGVVAPQPPHFADSRFWAQGLTLGLELSF